MKYFKNKHNGEIRPFPDGWYEANTGNQQENSNWTTATDAEVEAWQNKATDVTTTPNGVVPTPTEPKSSGGKVEATPSPADPELKDGITAEELAKQTQKK